MSQRINFVFSIGSWTLIFAMIWLHEKSGWHPKSKMMKKIHDYYLSLEGLVEKHHRVLFLGIFILCVLIRVIFPSVPGGLNQDEASMGYDAYATAFYGIDRNGFHFPVYAMSWGSGQNTLMMYFTAFFVRLFGLNIFTVRLTSLIFGIFAPVIFYLLVKRLEFKQGESFNPRHLPALTAFLLLSVSPWHIMLSRWALESNLLPGVFLMGVYILILAIQKNSTLFYSLSASIFALSMYAYATVCIIMPPFLIGIVAFLLLKKLINFRQLFYFGTVFLLFAIPMILFFAVNIFGWESIRTPLFSVPRFTVMRSSTSFNNIGQNFNELIQLLRLQNDNLPWNSIEGFGVTYLFLSPFAFIGVVSIVLQRRKFPYKLLLIWWFASGFVLGCLISVNINRINLIFIPFIYIISEGILFVLRKVKFGAIALFTVILVSFSAFAFTYFGDAYMTQIEKSFYASYGDAVKAAMDEAGSRIIYLTPINGTEAIVLFYTEFDPHIYEETVIYLDPNAEFRPVSSFGNFRVGIPQDKDISAIYVFNNEENLDFEDGLFEIKRFKYYSVAIGVEP